MYNEEMHKWQLVQLRNLENSLERDLGHLDFQPSEHLMRGIIERVLLQVRAIRMSPELAEEIRQKEK